MERMSLKLIHSFSSWRCLLPNVTSSFSVGKIHWIHFTAASHQAFFSTVDSGKIKSTVHCKTCMQNASQHKLTSVRSVSKYASQEEESMSSNKSAHLQNCEKKETSLIETSFLIEHNPQRALYSHILESFPEGIQLAFAYGSGAFQQRNNTDISKNMLDFIFVVDRPKRWHRLNMEKHPHHYSFLRHFGPAYITRIQERYGAGTYFNTLVSMEGRLIKYGVISTARLITDLLDWDSLYISGRLHKPVSLIIIPTNEDLLMAMKMNLRSAVHAALLLLPDLFTEEQFYIKIASLSYAGDIRMGLAEDKNKISNIVTANMQLFCHMYGPILMEEEHVTWWQTEGQLEQALTYHSRHHHLISLPGQVLYGLLLQKYQVGVFPDLEEIIKRHAYDSECGTYVASSIRDIVKNSSITQSVKGIATAGLIKSLRYSAKKVLKKLNSK